MTEIAKMIKNTKITKKISSAFRLDKFSNKSLHLRLLLSGFQTCILAFNVSQVFQKRSPINVKSTHRQEAICRDETLEEGTSERMKLRVSCIFANETSSRIRSLRLFAKWYIASRRLSHIQYESPTIRAWLPSNPES